MEDYRLTYLANNVKDEKFTIADIGVNFTLEGDKGTRFEMKPIIPHKITVDQGDRIMIISKESMVVKKKKAPKSEQLTIPEALE